MKFRSKPREIEAHQVVAPIDIIGDDTVPAWFHTIYENGVMALDETTGDGTIINATHGSEINFKDTDWIIFNGEDDVYPCTDEEFQQRYERIE